MKQDGKGSTRNHLEIKGERGGDIIHLIQRTPQILNQNHPSLIVILIHLCPHHLILVLQVMIGVREKRSLREEISTNEENERINGVTESGGGVIRDLSTDLEG